MPQSIAMQHAINQPFVFVGSLNQKPSFWSLSSKKRAGYVPLPDEPIANSSRQHLTDKAKPKRSRPISSIRDSIAGFDISQKVKQVVGRKRSRDDEADEAEPILERPVKAARSSRIGSAFWTKYRDLRGHHNAIEAMAEASSVAHAYDEQHGLDRPLPSQLECQSDEDDSPGWPGGDIDALQRYLDSVTVDKPVPQPDFGWAGKEIDDFRLYVRSADDDMLWEGGVQNRELPKQPVEPLECPLSAENVRELNNLYQGARSIFGQKQEGGKMQWMIKLKYLRIFSDYLALMNESLQRKVAAFGYEAEHDDESDDEASVMEFTWDEALDQLWVLKETYPYTYYIDEIVVGSTKWEKLDALL